MTGVQHEQLLRLARGRALARTGDARRIRMAAGVSARELARAVEVAPSTLARWERGETRPRGDAGLRYEAALGALADLAQ
jgi:transcriptional regulator with XRE-family HTH domain